MSFSRVSVVIAVVLVGLIATGPISGDYTAADKRPSLSHAVSANAASIPAFPGAEGFGAIATGGRGGRVLYVTTLAADPNGDITGSLNWALRQSGPRYILFKVSGIIHATAQIRASDVTIAGQTSPGGIIVRGLWCDGGHYTTGNSCNNIIVRHIRSRPATHIDNYTGEDVLEDALRLDALQRFVIDHCSFANASDETVQISGAMNGTIQNSLFAESVGDNYEYGGMLLNYSHSAHPQDYLSIHHNMWHRLYGRLPEITCAADSIWDCSDCQAHSLHLELSNNLIWDPDFLIWYNRYVNDNETFGPYRLQMNMVNNYMVARSDFSYGMMVHDFLEVGDNRLYFAGNRLNLYPAYSDYQLAYCCNDFSSGGPNSDMGIAIRQPARLDFAGITYTPTGQVTNYVVQNVGAFPRDVMDRRYISSLITGQIDPTPLDRPGANDAFALNFNPDKPPAPPQDSDSDGMPDYFEQQYGLNPQVADHNGTHLSVLFTGVAGYTNLECYLNWLSEHLVKGVLLPGSRPVYLPLARK